MYYDVLIMCIYSIHNILCTLYLLYMLYYIVYDNMNKIFSTMIILYNVIWYKINNNKIWYIVYFFILYNLFHKI